MSCVIYKEIWEGVKSVNRTMVSYKAVKELEIKKDKFVCALVAILIVLIVLLVFCGLLGFSIVFIGSLPILLVIGLIYLIKIWIDEISNHR